MRLFSLSFFLSISLSAHSATPTDTLNADLKAMRLAGTVATLQLRSLLTDLRCPAPAPHAPSAAEIAQKKEVLLHDLQTFFLQFSKVFQEINKNMQQK